MKKNNDDKDKKNVVLQAAIVHILGDMIQSIGVIIAGAIIFFSSRIHIQVLSL